MPWTEIDVMDQRTEFVLRAVRNVESFGELCREFGISRKTGYKWKERFLQDGLSGLGDQSRRPEASPNEVGESMVCQIVKLRVAHPTWGARKLRAVLQRTTAKEELPSESSFKRILDRAGLVQHRRRVRSEQSGRVQTPGRAERPNHVWTIDFKGWWRSTDGRRCEPFTVRDAYSRFVLAAQLVPSTRGPVVRRVLEKLFSKHGVPRAIQCDNGSPWVHMRSRGGLTQLSVWLVSLGIRLIRSRVACPQDNGGHERMHRDLSELQLNPARTRRKQQCALDRWVIDFNEVRPHHALSGKTPAEVYRVSERRPMAPQVPAYPPGWITRHVQSGGSICIDGDVVPIGAPLRGQLVGLRHESGLRWRAYFFDVDLGLIEIASLDNLPTIVDAGVNLNEGTTATVVNTLG